MLIGFAALVFLAMKVSGLTLAVQQESYKVIAKFENIGGLTERAKVTLAGVNIGRVSQINLDAEGYVADVEMEIDTAVNNLPIDSTAAILTAGLLGEKYIGLSVGAETDYLKEGDIIEDTQSSLVLEELIGSFLASQGN